MDTSLPRPQADRFMTTLINPLMIQHADDRTLLHALLSSNKLRTQWDKNHTFCLLHQGLKHKIQLTHTIVLIPPKDGLLSYRIISSYRLGEGTHSTVHAVECAFSFPNEHSIEYSQQNIMILKIQTFQMIDESRLHHVANFCLKEYALSNMTTHLGAEPPFITYDNKTQTLNSFMFMNRMPGVELFDIIKLHWTHYMPSTRLFKITIALLTAYKEQVLDRGIILHSDVKPENIMVEMGLTRRNLSNLRDPAFSPARVIINFIDYAYCLRPNEVITTRQGSPSYIAPEMALVDTPTAFDNEKPDIYSLGICLTKLWFRSHHLLPEIHVDYQEQLNLLSREIYAPEESIVSKNILKFIHHALIQMTLDDPKKRWSFNQSFVAFNMIAKMGIELSEPTATNTNYSAFQFFRRSELIQASKEAERNPVIFPDFTRSC